MNTTLTGTGGLVRLVLRRDRVLLPIWVLAFGLLPVSFAGATAQVYPTPEQLRQYHDSIVANPALRGTIGEVFGSNLGALTAWRSGTLMMFMAIVSLLTVIRHTRAEEDAGRRDLVGSAVVGRHAHLAAALAVTFAADLAVGLLIAATMAGYGTAGALAYGLVFAVTGWFFAAVGALAAQLTEGAGAARGIAMSVVGVAFVLRAAGDSSGSGGDIGWLSWLSPLGVAQRIRPYAGERWGLALALVLVSATLIAAAAALASRRDVGAGVLPARLGPATASPRLGSPLGLAWRLHRGSLLAWTFGLAAIGVVIGGASRDIEGFAQSPQVQQYLARLGGADVLRDAYLAASLGLLAIAAAGFAVQAALRMRAEETALRAEPVLATAVSRPAWLTSHLVFALLGPAAALAALGLTMGLASTEAGDDPAARVAATMSGAIAHLPAVWVLAGVAVAVFGLLPGASNALAWGAFAVCAFLTFVGQILDLDQRLLDLAPFTHVPRLPGSEFTATPLLWLAGAAAVLIAAGLAGFRRRDLG
ncbi:MAG TPA: ABC transporter permease [Pseudonocardiaceae bacterium]|nr:ABC transporter permease [Pseudonocardiaceae bacterium]